MRFIINLLLIGLMSLSIAHAEPTIDAKKVAILISSYGEEGRENLSYDLEELAQAYLVLHDNNVSIDILSPKGGAVLVKNNKDDLPYIKRFKTETPALKQLASTVATKKAAFESYDGILVIGGNGAMFDLPEDKATQKLLTHFAQNNMPMAAVCHGPAALVNIRLNDGSYFVAGKNVNGFTNLEEQAFGGDVISQLPFLLEDKLNEHGAKFVSNAPMLPYVSVDKNLITAQNPGAVGKATEALLTKMGVEIKARQPYKDEATLLLISQARDAGSYLIDIAIKTQPELYDLNYMALYGFYAYDLAQNKTDKLKELEIMETIDNYFDHPMYQAKLIKAQMEQGFQSKAESGFDKFKLSYPEHEMTNQLDGLVNK